MRHEILVGARTYQMFLLSSKEFNERVKILTGQDLCSKLGLTDHYNQEIYVCNDIHPELMREIIVHEIVHVMLEDAGLASLQNQNIELNEIVTSIISPRLTQVLSQNKKIFDLLFSGTR